MKYLKGICLFAAIILSSFSGREIAQAEKIIDTFQACYAGDRSHLCSPDKEREGELALHLWSGNLRYYVGGAILLLTAFMSISGKRDKSNNLKQKDASQTDASV